MYTYKIEGTVIYNEADNDEGYVTVEILETTEVEEMSADAAKEKFFFENPEYDDSFGSMKTCDQETRGGKGATYRDNEGRTIDVDLVD